MSENEWPVDPDNDELARVAAHLQDAVAPLPAEALARVERTIHAEVERSQWRRRRIALGWSLAAGILIAVSAYAFFRADNTTSVSRPGIANGVAPPARIEDRITIAVGNASETQAAEMPLVRLDDYRSLFAD